MELNIKYNEDRTCFSGTGTHFAGGQKFQIIEGEVSSKTKYWKFIAQYDSGMKAKKGQKYLVQVKSFTKFSRCFFHFKIFELTQ